VLRRSDNEVQTVSRKDKEDKSRLGDLKVAQIGEMHQPIGGQHRPADNTCHPELAVLPARTLSEHPWPPLPPLDLGRLALTQRTGRDQAVRAGGEVEHACVLGHEVPHEAQERLEDALAGLHVCRTGWITRGHDFRHALSLESAEKGVAPGGDLHRWGEDEDDVVGALGSVEGGIE
jgi:hypothetical protein